MYVHTCTALVVAPSAFRSECYFQSLLHFCNCSVLIPAPYVFSNGSYRQCISEAEKQCRKEMTRISASTEFTQKCRLQCKPSCTYWEFSPTISYSKFPSRNLREFVLENNIADLDGWENYVSLAVHYTDMQVW